MGKSCRLLLALVLLLLAAPALAAPCGGDINAFLGAIARDAQGQGVSRAVIDRAFAGLTPDPAVLAFDRRQRGMFHAKSFEEYAATRVSPARISRARKLLQVHAALLRRIEQQFGVHLHQFPGAADAGRDDPGGGVFLKALGVEHAALAAVEG